NESPKRIHAFIANIMSCASVVSGPVNRVAVYSRGVASNRYYHYFINVCSVCAVQHKLHWSSSRHCKHFGWPAFLQNIFANGPLKRVLVAVLHLILLSFGVRL